ncbi:oligopeptide transport system ATP-binding protein [Amphibacillus marinus]|uniref:Oligopeptide transport system ATP-binding protein n=1 Tax=Amphibacillus marinus TaxID=872970 RepID=A0A1H8M5M6_9BACI|nr:ABC transporter ATP-binding protein [Amphibacillus marinus]SEO12687.1 oligopeptide transport system ATP-binding protein [Amphibacillus marinus]
MKETLLEVKQFKFSFDTYAGEVQAVRNISFHVKEGETLAIVGESGSGKSVAVQNVMKLIPSPPGRIIQGQIIYQGEDITHYTDRQMEQLRGKELSMIFQDPMTSLNPTMKIGDQIIEGIRNHEPIPRADAVKKAIKLLTEVGIPDPKDSLSRYPHTFSGGMRQRVMIAIALACNPKILIADEPTTALDVTTQTQILELMNDLKEKHGTSIVMITHDLGVVAKMADRIAVMYAGKIVETGTVEEIFYQPKHPYTWGLLQSIPKVSSKRMGKLETIPGTPPDLIAPPKGCGFASRCKFCMNICKEVEPESVSISASQSAKCWLLDERAPRVEREHEEVKKYS